MVLIDSRALRLTLAAFCAAMLGAPTLAQYQDCRTCHYAVEPDGTAPDFTGYFATVGHHPVSVRYPSRADYNMTTAVSGSILFFDTDGDGAPGPYEVQIYRSTLGDMIECSSCHREHGTTTTTTTTTTTGNGRNTKKKTSTTSTTTAPAMYLRSDPNTAALCLFCHNL